MYSNLFVYCCPGNVRLPRHFANKLFGALLGRLKAALWPSFAVPDYFIQSITTQNIYRFKIPLEPQAPGELYLYSFSIA